ncbi:unnamed protein product [Didymodactylos carnosus]|uniref:Uncharacterized protein n=1 Tax=Didymodactylos carnosus TaxID=1234261 RepID=A0A814N641_9BILA|nr:unnamed protein product [Didymodactylos carnosus]CAF3852805.1 unnamed protein product [Didymodactylos carnosus]
MDNLNTLGKLLMRMGENTKAEYYFQMLLEDASLDHIGHALVYHNIGQVHNNQGDYEKALKYYEKCLNIYLISLPPTHRHIATTYNSIGQVYNNQGDYEKALKYYEKALTMARKTLPFAHPVLRTIELAIRTAREKLSKYSNVF